MTNPTVRLHALPDVAEHLKIPLRSLRERARRREFSHVHIGKERYLTDEQLAALVKRYEVRPVGEVKRSRPRRRAA